GFGLHSARFLLAPPSDGEQVATVPAADSPAFPHARGAQTGQSRWLSTGIPSGRLRLQAEVTAVDLLDLVPEDSFTQTGKRHQGIQETSRARTTLSGGAGANFGTGAQIGSN